MQRDISAMRTVINDSARSRLWKRFTLCYFISRLTPGPRNLSIRQGRC